MGWEFRTPKKPVPVAQVLGYPHRDLSHVCSPTWSPTATSDRHHHHPHPCHHHHLPLWHPTRQTTTRRKMCNGEDDEGRGRAVVPTPNSAVHILYFSHLPNAAGRGMPLLAAFLLFRHNEEGHIPLLVMSFLF